MSKNFSPATSPDLFEIPLLSLQCSLHPSFKIAKICQTCYLQQKHFLLCEKCLSLKDPISHQEHLKTVLTLDRYVDECLNNFQNIQSEEKEAKIMFSKLEGFLNEVADNEKVLEDLIETEIMRINQDFDIMMEKLEKIKEGICITKNKFIKTLNDDVNEMKKLKKELEKFSLEGSPLFRKKSCGNLEECINRLKQLSLDKEKQKEKNYIQETFGSLIKEFKKFESNFEMNYKKDYVEETSQLNLSEKNLSKREVSLQILNLMSEIRNKSKYPPKYKQFQNSNEEFDNFLKTLDKVSIDVSELSEKLLLTQHDVTYKFTGENQRNKVSFSSNNPFTQNRR